MKKTDLPHASVGRRASIVALGLSFSIACSAEGPASPAASEPSLEQVATPVGPLSRPDLCARPDDDAVRDVFCAATPPAISSLRELEHALGVNPLAAPGSEPERLQHDPTPEDLVDVAVVLAHSTALSGRMVSPINPRVIFLGQDVLMTFQRGIQQVEMVTASRARGAFNFYLLSFRQACSDRPGGCIPGDLYTPRIESDWTQLALQDDEELKNTPSDCRQCHQRGTEFPRLLMRELQAPWTHFFEPDVEPQPGLNLPGVRGRDLVHDYLRAKGRESYGGLGVEVLRRTAGLFLQNVVDTHQPLLFDAPGIEEERWPFGPDGYPNEPQGSPTWERAYEAFKRGEQLALPYYEPRMTDPAKQARLTDAYQRYQRGELPAEQLPDLADIFPDDPRLRARIGLATEPDASGPALLIQACGSCHNDVLDQTISRARFNIDLSRMSRAELNAAIDRIERPSSDPYAMPPRESRQLEDAGRARLIAYLRANSPTAEEAALLKRAATLGMTGGSRF